MSIQLAELLLWHREGSLFTVAGCTDNPTTR
jgi:hypothetical protein